MEQRDTETGDTHNIWIITTQKNKWLTTLGKISDIVTGKLTRALAFEEWVKAGEMEEDCSLIHVVEKRGDYTYGFNTNIVIS